MVRLVCRRGLVGDFSIYGECIIYVDSRIRGVGFCMSSDLMYERAVSIKFFVSISPFLLSSLSSPVDFACLCFISVPFCPLL